MPAGVGRERWNIAAPAADAPLIVLPEPAHGAKEGDALIQRVKFRQPLRGEFPGCRHLFAEDVMLHDGREVI